MEPRPQPRPLRPDDPLIQGLDIELVPTIQPFHEHDPNPGLQIPEQSSLEVANAYSHHHQHHQQHHPQSPPGSNFHLYPTPAVTTYPGDSKSWEKPASDSGLGAYPPTTTSAPPYYYSASSAAGSYTADRRYSDSDFQSPFDQRPLVVPAPAPVEGEKGKKERICGVRRQLFWLFLAVGVFVLVAAVGTGVGVGVGISGRNGSATTPSATATATRTLPVPLATATTSPSLDVTCPSSNLTLYTAQSYTDRKYLLLCGRDYNSDGGTQDMYNMPADTLSDCIDMCAGQEGCVGAGWGRTSSTNGKMNCWLKSKLAGWKGSAQWYFFIADTEENGGG